MAIIVRDALSLHASKAASFDEYCIVNLQHTADALIHIGVFSVRPLLRFHLFRL